MLDLVEFSKTMVWDDWGELFFDRVLTPAQLKALDEDFYKRWIRRKPIKDYYTSYNAVDGTVTCNKIGGSSETVKVSTSRYWTPNRYYWSTDPIMKERQREVIRVGGRQALRIITNYEISGKTYLDRIKENRTVMTNLLTGWCYVDDLLMPKVMREKLDDSRDKTYTPKLIRFILSYYGGVTELLKESTWFVERWNNARPETPLG